MMNRKSIAILIFIMTAGVLLSACGYKPPYQRGYDEGYEAGYTAAGGDVSGMPPAQSADQGSGGGDSSPMPSLLSSKEEETGDKSETGGDTNEDTAGDTVAADDEAETADTAEVTEETADTGSSDAEVLGDGSEPAESGGGQSSIPGGRVISAEAVNEALFTHPEIIDGLRDIYPDSMIFGEYVGDSETNLLHRVDGPHFAELTYNNIVVFDGSKSADDIVNEGFFTKCSCID